MRRMKIVADSSANLMTLDAVAFDCAPMKIITAEKEFVDDKSLDVDNMIDYFSHYKAKSLSAILKHLKENGLKTGKVYIAHCRNEAASLKMKAMIEEALPQVTVTVGVNLGLCSFYAERGGMLVGYEKF